MKKLSVLLLSFLLSICLFAQTEYIYDFNSLTVGTQCLNGQDNWSTHYQTASSSQDFDVDYVNGSLVSPDETMAVFYPYGGPGVGRTATRKATSNFNFNFQNGGVIDLEMDFYRVWWGAFYGVGFDADNDGNILVGMTEGDGGVYIKSSGTNDNQTSLNLPDGSSIIIASYTEAGWSRYKMSFDFNAFGGAGSVTVFVKPNCTGEWLQCSEATEVNLGLTPGSGDKFDYKVWNGVFFHCQGGTGAFDNLLVRQMGDGNVQYISMEDVPKQLITNPPLTLVATATSGLPVSFEMVSGPATIDGNTLTLTSEVGTVTFKAIQEGDENWLPAPTVYKTFDVIDALAYYPEIKIRRPYDDTKVYMPELNPVMIVVSAYIEHNDVLHVEKVTCNVDGQSIEAITYYPDDPTNGYFSCFWQPSAFGNHDLTVVVNTTGGQVTTATSTFEVIDSYDDISVVTINGDLICTPSVHSAIGEYVMPSHVGAFNAIIAMYDHNCVNGNCDTYDRIGGMNIRNYRGEWMELFRYISPFGVQCEDAVDVSDYTSLLQGLVEFEFFFESWNGDGYKPILTFNFTKGTPDYLYTDLKEIWNNTYSFGNYSNQQPVPVVDYEFNNLVESASLKMTTTGHNWGSLNTGNAAEFYEATHHIFVNGTSKYDQHLWRQCTPNPAGCQPQNGTWSYNRSGWCPGSIGMVWDWDLTDYINSGAELQYQFAPDYIDMCNPDYPDCVTGVTCSNCDDSSNPILIVSGKIVTHSNNPDMVIGISHFNNEINNYTVKFYPNPANSEVTFTADDDAFYTVNVFNIKGQLVKRFALVNSRQISVADLEKGTYIINITSGSKNINQKLIVY
ncbi:MAG: peptide-N-glycosidase F-related protein [Bacteroidales bacterium]|nr:T9SS type A sorting domain-containing protein [Bacteroidales bacterium]MDD2204967.1 peptide-N-glycosidase F-related protein [Bacteroidales bacterium]MDD3151817.1 peptide-N-glycosidase F-related protein [Bacteroidales bacterium]MDD3913909.1 peptide-N-glycosidase F-related protein [Bacteroidales bacterium]